MYIDGATLRERMRSRTAADLRDVLEHRAEYTPVAVAAAEEELALRAPEDESAVAPEDRSLRSEDRSLRSRLPFGLRIVFWYATVVAVGGAVVLPVAAGVFIAHGMTLRQLAPGLGKGVLQVALAAWTGIAIRGKHAYVRVLLLSVIAGYFVLHVTSIAITRELTIDAVNGAGLLIVAFWYFGFHEDVVRYYRGER